MAIYKVNTPEGVRYVNANTKLAALNHCIDNGKKFSAESVTAEELADAFDKGSKVEKAT